VFSGFRWLHCILVYSAAIRGSRCRCWGSRKIESRCRALNNQTIKNRYALPHIDTLLEQLHGALFEVKPMVYHCCPLFLHCRSSTAAAELARLTTVPAYAW
jgi:hypothetical protein